jgi:hypothetical protein
MTRVYVRATFQIDLKNNGFARPNKGPLSLGLYGFALKKIVYNSFLF